MEATKNSSKISCGMRTNSKFKLLNQDFQKHWSHFSEMTATKILIILLLGARIPSILLYYFLCVNIFILYWCLYFVTILFIILYHFNKTNWDSLKSCSFHCQYNNKVIIYNHIYVYIYDAFIFIFTERHIW